MELWEPIGWEYGTQSPPELRSGLRCSKIWPSYKSNLVASWMHLQHCRSFQEHLRMLLQILRALCLAPGGPGSIWKYLEALLRSTGVSGRCEYGFQTDLHFADELHLQTRPITASKCISEFTWSQPPSVCPNFLDHGLRVYLWVHSIIILRFTSSWSQALPDASPYILCVDW